LNLTKKLSTSEHEEKNKQKERSDNLPQKYEGIRITLKVYRNIPSWKIAEIDEKPCIDEHTNTSKLKDIFSS